ncbi:hypothetical protein EBU71_21355, partial [bacterium]|nr:hypothetical protein [Candidatus Elulimicrobium humile]
MFYPPSPLWVLPPKGDKINKNSFCNYIEYFHVSPTKLTTCLRCTSSYSDKLNYIFMSNICVTGIQPTGKIHIGNYFGAMKPLLELSRKPEFDKVLMFVVNLHSLNSIKDAETLRNYTKDIVLDFLSMDIDISKSSLFLQSEIRALTELTWIFNNLVSVAYLERSHAYKDAVANGKEANMGLF